MYRLVLALCVVISVLLSSAPAMAQDPPPEGTPAGEEGPVAPDGDQPGGAALIFSDDFQSNANGWDSYRDDSAVLGLQHGAYRISLLQQNKLASVEIPLPDPVADFALEVDATPTAGWGPFYGVLFRAQDLGNYYQFGVSGTGGYRFGKVENGEFVSFVDHPAPAPAANFGVDSTNAIKVVAKGSSFEFFVNGVKVASEADSTFSTGKMALFVGTPQFVPGAAVAFTGLRIWEAPDELSGSPAPEED